MVAADNVTISNSVTLNGSTVNLILCDGKKLTIYNDDESYDIESGSLNIYGQEDQSGIFAARTNLSSLRLYGGNFDVSDESRINYLTVKNGTITGGRIKEHTDVATAANISGGIVQLSSLTLCNVTITGGQVSAGGIGNGFNYNISLGWTDPTDYVQAGYYSGNITFTKPFVLDGTNTLAAADNIEEKKIVPAYSVILPENVTGGDVEADKQYVGAGSGDTVTLTVTPDAGFTVKSVTAGSAAVTKVDDTHYSFTMPDEDAVVSIELAEKCPVELVPDTSVLEKSPYSWYNMTYTGETIDNYFSIEDSDGKTPAELGFEVSLSYTPVNIYYNRSGETVYTAPTHFSEEGYNQWAVLAKVTDPTGNYAENDLSIIISVGSIELSDVSPELSKTTYKLIDDDPVRVTGVTFKNADDVNKILPSEKEALLEALTARYSYDKESFNRSSIVTRSS